MPEMAELFLVAAVLWLVVVLPAAAITALKEQWLLFITGFLTLGTVWLVGAVTLAPSDSWWAERFYDERRSAAAGDREVRPRPLRNTVATLGAILAGMVALVCFAAFPSPILGVDGKSLEYSVGGSTLFPSKPCRKRPGETWLCSRWDNQSSGTADYRVTVDSLGCWTATRQGRRGEGSDKRFSGCITVVDHLRLFD